MLLKYLINPGPSIILSFIAFCILILSISFAPTSDVLTVFLAILKISLCVFIAISLNNFIYKKNIIRKDNIIVGAVFILLSSFFADDLFLLIAVFLMFFLVKELFDTYQKEQPFSQFFNASFIVSLITFLYPNLIILLVFIVITSANYSNLNWRILFTILLGFITPYFFYFTLYFLLNTPINNIDFITLKKNNFLLLSSLSIMQKICFSILSIITLMSFFELFSWLYKKSIKSRKAFINLIFLFIVTLFTSFFSELNHLSFTVIPLTVILANYFIYSRNRKVANILFYMFIISCIACNPLITF